MVHDGAVDIVLFAQGVVAIPVEFAATGVGAIEELNEADSVLDQASSEDTVARKANLERVFGVIRAVHFEDVGGLGREVADFWDAELHPGGEFITGDTGRESAFSGMVTEVFLIEFPEESPGGCILRGAHAGWRNKIAHGILGAEGRALELGRKKAGPPIVDAGLGNSARVGDGDEGGKVLVFGAEGVGQPGAEAWEAIEDKAGGE